MTGVFISWAADNGRTRDLAAVLGLEATFIHRPGRFGLVGRYLRQHAATRRLLMTQSPARVVLMLPPAFALWSVLGALPRTTPLVTDLHTGFFLDPKWKWAARPTLRAMKHASTTAVVTNQALAEECARHGVTAVVLHDILVERRPAPHEQYLLCPLSYANDEPVAEILGAAAQTPSIEWRLTGSPPESVRAAAPPNVTFTGFVSQNEYDDLVRRSLGVVALTTRPHTMQRAGYEAFNAGVPQLTSDFPELRDFYAESACFAAPNATSIAAGAERLRSHRDHLQARLLEIRAQRVQEQRSAIAQLRGILELHEPRS